MLRGREGEKLTLRDQWDNILVHDEDWNSESSTRFFQFMYPFFFSVSGFLAGFPNKLHQTFR